jgi:poly(3-hydroxyalkanoate) depolymerase
MTAKAAQNDDDTPREPHIELMRVMGRDLRVAIWRAAPPPGQAPGRPLLFFNGVGANIEVMSPLAAWFPDRDLVTFDMPGVGGSPSPRFPYRAWTMALRTARLLDRLGYRGPVDVMGVSWGGAMAQQFAFQHPGRVGKLILAATSAGMLMVPGDPRSLAKMADPRRYVDDGYMLRHFEALYGGAGEGKQAHVGRLIPPTRTGYAYQLTAMLGWTSVPFLPLLRMKTLVIMGERDRIVPLVNGRLLAGLIPHARLEVVAGGHLFLVTDAERSAAVVGAFLAEPDAPAKAERQAA